MNTRFAGLAMFAFVSLTAAGCVSAEVPDAPASGAPEAPAVATAADPWGGRYPMHTLANEHLALLLPDPDAEKGFYRAARFDRSGMVLLATTAGGTNCFGPIRSPADHDPGKDDQVAGTAEEFGMESPLGYDDAKPGEGFVKIGVGVLERIDDEPYFFRRNYPVLDPGKWEVEYEDDHATYTHTLDGPRGWGYRYIKLVTLHDDAPGFTIARSLTNTGEHSITTEHYGHNFIRIDGVPPGPGYRVSFPFEAEPGEPWKPAGNAAFDGGDLVLLRKVQGSIWGKISGWDSQSAADHAATVSYRAPDADADAAPAVSFHTDRPLSKLVVYSGGEGVCPEGFVAVALEPGETMKWETVYRLRDR